MKPKFKSIINYQLSVINYILLFMFSFLALSCSPSREKRLESIQSLEGRMYGSEIFAFDKFKADSLIDAYTSFTDHFPKDSLAPVFLFKAANMAITEEDGNKAVALFDRIYQEYPDHPKSALAVFFKGYVYENLIRNLYKAKEIYLQFIEKYPESDFADDAQMALQNLGKTPEQMIKEFEERRKADSLSKK